MAIPFNFDTPRRAINEVTRLLPPKKNPTSRGGASHGTLVPLHLTLLGFCFFFFVSVCVCVCVCVVLQIYIVFTRGAPNKAVKKKIKNSDTILHPLRRNSFLFL